MLNNVPLLFSSPVFSVWCVCSREVQEIKDLDLQPYIRCTAILRSHFLHFLSGNTERLLSFVALISRRLLILKTLGDIASALFYLNTMLISYTLYFFIFYFHWDLIFVIFLVENFPHFVFSSPLSFPLKFNLNISAPATKGNKGTSSSYVASR